MSSFNSFTREQSMSQKLLNSMTNELQSTSRTSPNYLVLLQAIENLQYSMHRDRITGSNNTTTTLVTKAVTNTNTGVHMQAPTFSNDLVARKQQYMEYLVAHEGYDVEEVVAMDMRTLRIHIDKALPITITVHSAHANGGTTKHYIVRKAA